MALGHLGLNQACLPFHHVGGIGSRPEIRTRNRRLPKPEPYQLGQPTAHQELLLGFQSKGMQICCFDWKIVVYHRPAASKRNDTGVEPAEPLNRRR